MIILLATWNRKKADWLTEAFNSRGLDIEVVDPRNFKDVEETGSTCEENALIKVRSVGIQAGSVVAGEDSALLVDSLEGFPGVKTARWIPGSDDDRARKLLEMMRDIPGEKRTARFQSSIALLFPDGKELTCTGNLEGQISREFEGDAGWGYQGIFKPFEEDIFKDSITNTIAANDHRDKAVKLAVDAISDWMQNAL